MNLPEGMMLRPAQMTDVEAVVHLLNACSKEEIGAEEYSVSEWAGDWGMDTFNLAEDTRVVVFQQQIVAYADTFGLPPYVKLYCIVRVLPAFRGQGIEQVLMDWIEKRCQALASHAPEGAKVTADLMAYQQTTYLRDLYERHHYQHVRNFFHMMIEQDSPPPAPVLSEGITLRHALSPQEDRAVYEAYLASFADHWGFVARPFETIIERFKVSKESFDPTLWFLAMDGDSVAGICLCHVHLPENPQKGWVGTLGVVPAYRKRGIGLALLHHAFGEFYRRGYRRVELGVDANSLTGATRLYEKAGMKVFHSVCLYQKTVREGVDLTTQDLVTEH